MAAIIPAHFATLQIVVARDRRRTGGDIGRGLAHHTPTRNVKRRLVVALIFFVSVRQDGFGGRRFGRTLFWRTLSFGHFGHNARQRRQSGAQLRFEPLVFRCGPVKIVVITFLGAIVALFP